jgi:perosamine synthetase
MPANRVAIPQMEPLYGEEEIRAVTEYMRGGGWLTEHVVTHQFERELAAFAGMKHCVATANGTASLATTLFAANIGPGDEVIVPDLTMIATANAVRLAGARPVLADVDERTLCLDVAQIAGLVTGRTRAIVAVSLNGRSPDMLALEPWCRRQGLLLIEDAAQSFGSRSCGRQLGTFGWAGCFSFSPHKIITTGQGGAVITNDDGAADAIRKVKDFGRRRSGIDEHERIGFNFKFTDVQAAIGLAQLAKIDTRIARKKAMFAAYRQQLEGIGGAVRFVQTDLSDVTPWFIDVLVDERAALRAVLANEGIETRPFYPAIHTQPAYAEDPSGPAKAGHHLEEFPVAERISAAGLWLPSSLKLTDQDIERVCASIRAFYGLRP